MLAWAGAATTDAKRAAPGEQRCEAAAEAARRDIATALQRERRYLQQMQEEKDKEISRLEKQLAIFCPPYESKLVNP